MILHGFLSWIGFVDFMSYMLTLFSDGNFTAKQGGGGLSHLLYRGRVSLLRNSHLNGKQKTGLGNKHPSYCLQQSSVKTDASHWTLKMYFWTTHSTKKTKIKWQLFCIEMKFWSVHRVTAESVFPNGHYEISIAEVRASYRGSFSPIQAMQGNGHLVKDNNDTMIKNWAAHSLHTLKWTPDKMTEYIFELGWKWWFSVNGETIFQREPLLMALTGDARIRELIDEHWFQCNSANLVFQKRMSSGYTLIVCWEEADVWSRRTLCE